MSTNYQPTEGVRMLRELATEMEAESREIVAAITELFRTLPYPKRPSVAFEMALERIENMFGVKYEDRT